MKIPKLSLVELFVGFLIQMPFYYLIGNWVFTLAGASSVLWALGGAADSNKIFRRFLVPFALESIKMAAEGATAGTAKGMKQ